MFDSVSYWLSVTMVIYIFFVSPLCVHCDVIQTSLCTAHTHHSKGAFLPSDFIICIYQFSKICYRIYIS